jgi:hypothetical protein
MTSGAPIFETPEEMQNKIDEYFDKGVKIRTVVIGTGKAKQALKIPVPTITGLCIYLGFASRQSFYDHEKRDGFSYTVKKARMFIECEYEEQLQNGNVAGAIFALKNMGWKDKQELDVTTREAELTEEQIDAQIKALQNQLNAKEG